MFSMLQLTENKSEKFTVFIPSTKTVACFRTKISGGDEKYSFNAAVECFNAHQHCSKYTQNKHYIRK
jgi:hypothetical protein